MYTKGLLTLTEANTITLDDLVLANHAQDVVEAAEARAHARHS